MVRGGTVLVVLWLARPVATGLVLGAIMGFTLQPLYETLRRVLPSRVLVSVVIVLTAGHLIVGAVVGFISLFVSRGAALTATLVASLGPGGPPTSGCRPRPAGSAGSASRRRT